MSTAQNYKIIIGFDDSQMQKLSKQFAGTFGTPQAGGAATGGGNTALFKNLTKLGLIATASIGTLKGIEKLVSLTVSSSPILGTMLKLLSTAITFILRPIGDFIGFFLRPMLVQFLRFSLTLYKEWGPVMRNLGAVLGSGVIFEISKETMTSLTSNISGTLALLTGDWEKAFQISKESNERIGKKWGELVTSFESIDFITLINNLSAQITSALTGVGVGILGTIDFSGINSSTQLWSNNFMKNVTDVNNALTTGFNSFISFFDGMDTNLSVLYTGVILPGVNAIGEFFNTMTTSITDIITTAWDAITQFFQQIVDFFTTIPQQIMGSILPQAAEQPVVSGQANPIGLNINFYDTIIEGAESISDFGDELSSRIQEVIAGGSS